jgi:tetratricopeptide (TPR) repeat protein
MGMADHQESLRQAESLAASHQWGAAAVMYARAAAQALKTDAKDAARQAYEAAGEAWRRDDRPLSAAQALGMALELGPEGPQAALARVKLAGVLGELGETESGIRLCREAAAALPPGPAHALVLDTWIEALQALGRKEDARKRLDELKKLGEEGPLALAIAFREGQLARMDGRLDEAGTRFASILVALEEIPEGAAGMAAAEAELAEIASLKGDAQDALSLYDAACRRFEDIGRRALVWRGEAGRVRAAVDAGVQPLVRALDEGIAEAATRQMVVLEIDLRIARAVGTAATSPENAARDLDQAIAAADRIGHRPRAGRARLERARRLEGTASERIALLERAQADLVGNEPWLARARLAHARVLAPDRPAEAAPLAAAALARLTAMDMDRDASEARTLVRQLSTG